MAKESVVKKVGKFVANELLGVDDAKRAVSKARKGDIKGAIKSAAAGALEAGTTLTGAGVGAKVGAKVGLKAGEKIADSGAKRVAQAVGKKVAESTPAGRYGKAGGETKAVRTEGAASTTSRSGAKSTSTDSVRVEYTNPKKTPAQRAGVQKAQDTKRQTKIYNAVADAYEGAKEASRAPSVGKTTGKVTGAAAGTAAVASTKRTETSTQSGNVRHRDYTKKTK